MKEKLISDARRQFLILKSDFMLQSNQGGSNRSSGPAGNSKSEQHSGNSNKGKSTRA
jgi:hypothetical protein